MSDGMLLIEVNDAVFRMYIIWRVMDLAMSILRTFHRHNLVREATSGKLISNLHESRNNRHRRFLSRFHLSGLPSVCIYFVS